jgi:glutaminyl-tRNA synthetase
MSTDPTLPHGGSSSDGPGEPAPRHFLQQIIDQDLASGKHRGRVHTRFPPEPNGYLHIGHAKSICLNFGLAKEFGGKFNLRFDDTNPAKEEQEYVDSIKGDVKWLGADFDVGPHAGGLHFASNYFEQMYAWAEELVQKGRAYVCDLTAEEMSRLRGTPSIPAQSPHRDRAPEESLRLLREMRAGKYPNGAKTLRAKIDLASPNFTLRDPVMYRIVHEHHHNTGDAWCIYPMYDWAHCLEDSLEGITHSICTLEFENNRPLYHWFIDSINEGRTEDGSGPWGKRIHHPQQIEFARLNLTYTVMSKRFLLKLVQEGKVSGWDDPRMPTLSGVRRRGFTPEAMRNFCEEIGVTRQNSMIDVGRLENAVRDHLNKTSPRFMAVLRPIKLVIENWPEGKVDELDAVNNPEDVARGGAAVTRKVPFTRELYIERDDFMETPAKKFFRLAPGQEVRLRWAYFVKCTKVVKDARGNITEVRATYDPETRGGDAPPGPNGEPPRKVKGTIHWVSASHAKVAEARLFDRLFKVEEPGAGHGDYMLDLNEKSLEVIGTAYIEPAAAGVKVGDRVQFERVGYFCVDRDSSPGKLVFNRTVTLKDTWAKEAKKD